MSTEDAPALPVQSVPVVVFVAIPAADVLDGARLAVIALRQAMTQTTCAPSRLPVTIHAHLRDGPIPATVTAIAELNQATANGLLRTVPSGPTFPREQPGDHAS